MGLLDFLSPSQSGGGVDVNSLLSNPMFSGGLGLLAASQGQPGQGRPTIGAGINGFLQGVNNAQDYQRQALQLAFIKQKQEQQKRQQDALYGTMQNKPWTNPDNPQAGQLTGGLMDNLPPEQRTLAAAFPDQFGSAIAAQAFPKPVTPTSDIQNYNFAKENGYKGGFMKWKRDEAMASRAPTAPDSATVKYNLLVANGTPTAEAAKIVAGGSGAGRGFYAIPTSSGYIKMDKTTGETSPITAQDMKSGNIEPITGGTPAPTQQAPMMLPPSADVNLAAAKASATQQGNVQGQAAANMPSTIQSKDYVLGIIDSIINDPQLPNALGMIDSNLPNITGYNTEVRSRIDQLKGNSFLQAYQGLKGGGQITEVEGIKATEAQMRINEAQTPAEFKSALRDAADLIKQRFNVQRQQAGAGVVQPGQGMSSDDALINKYLK